MYNTIRDLTFISNYFDEKGNTKIANKLDKISLDLIERYPTEIWIYLNELGMTVKGSWRQQGYERELQQR